MVEESLFYSSLMLSVMSCLALALYIYLRLQHNKIRNVPKDLSANVFNKTFIVFNPYSEPIKIIHNFLSLMPILVFFAGLGLAIATFTIIGNVFFLSFIILIICVNLIIVDEMPDTIGNTKTFLKAYNRGSGLGVGDLRVVKLIRRALPKLANYYLGLTVFFAVTAVLLSYFGDQVILGLFQSVGLLIQSGASFGAVGWQVTVFLYAILLVAIQFLIKIMKGRFSRYIFGQLS
jgi:hypothetical protein